jgi:hypothetical protein
MTFPYSWCGCNDIFIPWLWQWKWHIDKRKMVISMVVVEFFSFYASTTHLLIFLPNNFCRTFQQIKAIWRAVYRSTLSAPISYFWSTRPTLLDSSCQTCHQGHSFPTLVSMILITTRNCVFDVSHPFHSSQSLSRASSQQRAHDNILSANSCLPIARPHGCWRWISVNLAMSLPLVLAWILYLILWY